MWSRRVNIDPTLKLCPWCGKPAGIRQDERLRYDSDGWPTFICKQWQVCCTGCNVQTQVVDEQHNERGQVSGHADAKGEAIRRWQERDVAIPFSITLPASHLITNRTIENSRYSWERKGKLEVQIAKERGIAAHFHRALTFLVEDGQINPCRFTLVFPMESIVVRLTEMSKEYTWENVPTVFRFRIESTSTNRSKNTRDTAWLKREIAPRPPLYDNLFQHIKDSEPQDDEDGEFEDGS